MSAAVHTEFFIYMSWGGVSKHGLLLDGVADSARLSVNM